jgi:hypothetical protein
MRNNEKAESREKKGGMAVERRISPLSSRHPEEFKHHCT